MNNEQLIQRIQRLEQIINDLVRPDRYQFDKTIQTFTGGKIGFYGATPVIQPSSTGEIVGASAVNLTNATTFTGNLGSTAYTVLDIVKHLKEVGAIKT